MHTLFYLKNDKVNNMQNSKGWRLWILIYQSIGVVYGGLGMWHCPMYAKVISLQSLSLIFLPDPVCMWHRHIALVCVSKCLHLNTNGS